MFWIALELSIPIIGFNIMLSLTVKKLDAFKLDGVAESDNTERGTTSPGPHRAVNQPDSVHVLAAFVAHHN